MVNDQSGGTEFQSTGMATNGASGPPLSALRLQPRNWTPPAKDSRDDRMELGEIWQMLLQRRRTILLCAGAVVGLVFFATMFSRMQFRARGSLYLGDLQSKGGVQTALPDQLDFLSGGSGDMGTEIEILKSENLVKRAVFESGLNVTVAPVGWSPPRYWHWRLARRDLELLDVGAQKLIAQKASLPPTASRTKSFMVKFLGGNAYELLRAGHSLGRGTMGVEFSTRDVTVTLMSGPEGPPAVGAEYAMTVTAINRAAEDAGKALTITVPTSAGPNDSVKVATVSFGHASPQMAAAFVDKLMRAYLERRQAWKNEEATAAETFVTGQVRSVKESLDDAERKLAEYKKNSTVVVLGSEAKSMIDQIGKYEQQRVAAQMQVSAFDQIQGVLKNRHASLEQHLVGEADDPVLAGLSSSLALAQQDLRRAEERFTPDAPAVQEQKAQVKTQLAMVKNYVHGRHTRAEQQLRSLNQLIGQFEQKLKTVPHAELELAQLTRNAEVMSKMFSFLLERQQQAAITKASTISRSRILDSSTIPSREDAPVLGTRLVMSGLLGLLLGVVAVILRRKLAATFQTDTELRKDLSDLPLFAVVPQHAPRQSRGRPALVAGEAPRGLPFDVFSADPHSAFAEAFRHLRTNVYYYRSAPDKNLLLITSPSPGDGKTLCTLTLAAALAADSRRTLVIEADMRRPTHHTLFHQSPEPGLSSVLTKQDIIRTVTTASGSFDVITAGAVPPNPTELLSSPQFVDLLTRARKTYDFVLIDSPPFPLVSDALILSMHADCILTVVRLQNTRRRATEEHLRRLSAFTTNHGLVINDIRAAATYGYGYHGYDTRLAPDNDRMGRIKKSAGHFLRSL